jgi:hypothetical protein
VSKLRRAASALLALGLALGLFAAPPAPARAEESGAGLSATVFAFDFSGSIFCYADGVPNAACKNPINEALSEAVEALAEEIAAEASKYTARKIDFHVTRFGSASRGSVSVCRGNTGTQTALLVSCLKEVARLYLKPSSQLGGTAFAPVIETLADFSGQRCGLILFTDGTPDEKDKDKALSLAQDSSCAILPVSTGPGDVDQDYLRKIVSTELDTIPGCSDQEFLWPKVYFETARDAAGAIGRALDKVACLLRVPEPDCMTVAEYEVALANLGLVLVIGNGIDGSQYPSVSGLNPLPGKRVDKDSKVALTAGSAAAPAQCAPVPPPTEPPPPPPPPTPPCVADGPIAWLGCNPWWLFLLIGLVIARLLWIRREIEVSVNGQTAVGLGSGPWNGFDVYSGDARMNLNPRAESIQVHRSFIRSARLEDRRPLGSAGAKIPLRMDDEIALQDGVRFTVGYGSGGSDSEGSGEVFTSSSSSQSSSGSSSSAKELEW